MSAEAQVDSVLLRLRRACATAMEVQARREQIRSIQPIRGNTWDQALSEVKAGIAEHDKGANEVIDLDAVYWHALKAAIQGSPRFQEMYRVGGTFTDAVSTVCSWLNEDWPAES